MLVTMGCIIIVLNNNAHNLAYPAPGEPPEDVVEVDGSLGFLLFMGGFGFAKGAAMGVDWDDVGVGFGDFEEGKMDDPR